MFTGYLVYGNGKRLNFSEKETFTTKAEAMVWLDTKAAKQSWSEGWVENEMGWIVYFLTDGIQEAA